MWAIAHFIRFIERSDWCRIKLQWVGRKRWVRKGNRRWVDYAGAGNISSLQIAYQAFDTHHFSLLHTYKVKWIHYVLLFTYILYIFVREAIPSCFLISLLQFLFVEELEVAYVVCCYVVIIIHATILWVLLG